MLKAKISNPVYRRYLLGSLDLLTVHLLLQEFLTVRYGLDFLAPTPNTTQYSITETKNSLIWLTFQSIIMPMKSIRDQSDLRSISIPRKLNRNNQLMDGFLLKIVTLMLMELSIILLSINLGLLMKRYHLLSKFKEKIMGKSLLKMLRLWWRLIEFMLRKGKLLLLKT